jgi:hypothetical protein
MKHLIVFSLLALMVGGCCTSKTLVREFPPNEIVRASELKEKQSDIEDLKVYLDEGDTFPLKLSVKSDLIGLEEKQVTLVAKRRIYIWVDFPEGFSRDEVSQMTKEEQRKAFLATRFYLSPDGRTWVPVRKQKTLMKAFGIEGGSISFGLDVSAKKGVTSQLSIRSRGKGQPQ